MEFRGDKMIITDVILVNKTPLHLDFWSIIETLHETSVENLKSMITDVNFNYGHNFSSIR